MGYDISDFSPFFYMTRVRLIGNAIIFLPAFSVEYTELGCASNIAFYKIYEKHVRRATQIRLNFRIDFFQSNPQIYLWTPFRAE